MVRRARRAGPDLRDVAVAAVQLGQARFRADDAPVRVVDEAMGRHVAADRPTGAPVVVLHMAEHLLERPAVQEVFQLRRPPLAVHRLVRRLPWLVVEALPFPLEAFRVACPGPELGFLQMHCLHARIEASLHANAQVLAEVLRRAHVVHVAAVADLLAVAVGLRVVHVVRPVEPAVEIVLIMPPRDAGHQVHAVAAVPPALHAVRQRAVDAVHHGHVGPEVAQRAPGLRRLEAGALADRRRVLGEGRRIGRHHTGGTRQADRRAQEHREIHRRGHSTVGRRPGGKKARPTAQRLGAVRPTGFRFDHLPGR